MRRKFWVTVLLTMFVTEAYSQTLAIYIWEDYIAPEVISEFTEEFSAKIQQVYYDSDEAKDQWLAETGGAGVDIIVGSGSTMHIYPLMGWLDQIPDKSIPNLQHIAPSWLSFNEGLKQYAVPYLWGTMGVVYRTDLISTQIDSWQQVFDPAASWRSKMLLVNDSREILAMALRSLGYSINTTNLSEIDKAGAILAKNPAGIEFGYLSLEENNRLDKGEIWLSTVYSGDGLVLSERNPKVHYVLPKEGSYLWLDYIAVTAKSANKALAWQFINFLNRPEIAAKQSLYLQYATPNESAKKFLPPDHLSNEAIYPSADKMRQSERFVPMPANVIKRRNQIFNTMLEGAGK